MFSMASYALYLLVDPYVRVVLMSTASTTHPDQYECFAVAGMVIPV